MRFHVVTQPVSELTLGGTASTVVRLDRVDWSRQLVLVADMGEQRTGGYSIRFREVRTTGGSLEAVVDVVRPGPSSMVIQVLTHPYAVTTVDRRQLPAGPVTVRFVDGGGTEMGRVQAAL
jgi:hypothetical protein